MASVPAPMACTPSAAHLSSRTFACTWTRMMPARPLQPTRPPAHTFHTCACAQITKPPATGARLGLTLDLAGVGLCAKSSVYELFNFTVQRVRASMLRTARDLQVRRHGWG